MFRRVAAFSPDLVILAGCAHHRPGPADALGRAHAQHPSLAAAGKYRACTRTGAHSKAGDREHGASVHYVTAELDGGPVIARVAVPIVAGDDAQTLAERLLPLEHRLYVAVLGLVAAGRLRWNDGAPWLDGTPLAAPLLHDGQSSFIDPHA